MKLRPFSSKAVDYLANQNKDAGIRRREIEERVKQDPPDGKKELVHAETNRQQYEEMKANEDDPAYEARIEKYNKIFDQFQDTAEE
jgi:hypothetical protein